LYLTKLIYYQSLVSSFNTSGTSGVSSNFILEQKSGHGSDYILVVEIFDNMDRLADYISHEYFIFPKFRLLKPISQIIMTVTATQNNISNFQAFSLPNSKSFGFINGNLIKTIFN